MHTIKVDINKQRKRFKKLLGTMNNHEQVAGYYVMEYIEFKERGIRYARFTLHEAEDEVPWFGS